MGRWKAVAAKVVAFPSEELRTGQKPLNLTLAAWEGKLFLNNVAGRALWGMAENWPTYVTVASHHV